MASSGLFGPYALDNDTLDNVLKGTGPGAYLLGEPAPNGEVYVDYTGRADSDLKDRLRDHVGTATLFKYGFFKTAEAAYLAECRLFHDFNPPRNTIHPAAPKGTLTTCPYCRPKR